MKILHITSSIRGDQSFSTKLSTLIIEKLQKRNTGSILVTRNLAETHLPHLTETHVKAFANSENLKDSAIPLSNILIEELIKADVIVIGVPMYNFTIPSMLKSWIDFVTRAGKTFQYTAGGFEGFVKGKKVYLAISSGGIYSEGPRQVLDHTESYLKDILKFIGMEDIETFRIEGVNIPVVKDTALDVATQKVEKAFNNV